MKDMQFMRRILRLDWRTAKRMISIVFARSRKYLVVAVLVLTTGMHWAALQTVAWTTMLANNLRTQSVSEAVSKTFDGEHPCPLCKAIATGKKSEKKSERVSPTMKMECPLVANRFDLISPKSFLTFTRLELSADSSCSRPPVPPPRNSFV